MNTSTLSIDTLSKLSDSLAEDFAQQLEAAVTDCKQRPSLAQAREITLKLTIKPDPEDPDDVIISPVTTRKTPARKILPVKGRRTRGNQIQFDWSDDLL